MSSEFWVDTDGLRADAGSFNNDAEQAVVLADYIRTHTVSNSSEWGDDAIGQAFALVYVPIRTDLIDGLDGVSETLEHTGRGVKLMGVRFESIEDHNVGMTQRLQTMMEARQPAIPSQPRYVARSVAGEESVEPGPFRLRSVAEGEPLEPMFYHQRTVAEPVPVTRLQGRRLEPVVPAEPGIPAEPTEAPGPQ